MTAKRDFVITKVSFVLDSAHSTHAIDNQAVRFRSLLEPLLAAPWKAKISETLRGEADMETHRSCCDR
jgi:hypothetical protein